MISTEIKKFSSLYLYTLPTSKHTSSSGSFLFEMLIVSGTIGEGNGTPLQYSCLENSMDRGAW